MFTVMVSYFDGNYYEVAGVTDIEYQTETDGKVCVNGNELLAYCFPLNSVLYLKSASANYTVSTQNAKVISVTSEMPMLF